ncbi:hypothetical protein V8G54_023118 [Vigna mungo]|uniref:Uncharacterized protein n=1 Tax=Vigna mungo TaxID=3915 RepID=A0AAQ3RQ12_VIGMU
MTTLNHLLSQGLQPRRAVFTPKHFPAKQLPTFFLTQELKMVRNIIASMQGHLFQTSSDQYSAVSVVVWKSILYLIPIPPFPQVIYHHKIPFPLQAVPHLFLQLLLTQAVNVFGAFLTFLVASA